MKLKVWAFARAVGLVSAVVFTICAFFVALAPEATADFIGYLFHINLSGLTRSISWGSYISGVFAVGMGTALWAAAVAKIYNLSL